MGYRSDSIAISRDMGPPRTSVRDVRAKMLVFRDSEGLTEVFGRMSAGISGPKLPLWADFSFLTGLSHRYDDALPFMISQVLVANM